MDELLAFVETYGLPVFVIACIIIAVVGILKICKVFDKIQSDNLKKFIYYAIDIVLSFIGVALYFAIFKIKFDWGYVHIVLTQIGATTALYTLYENIGIRKLWQMFISWIKEKLTPTLDKTITSLTKKYELADIVEKIAEVNHIKAETEEEQQPVTEEDDL